jgi:hypothetical protein
MAFQLKCGAIFLHIPKTGGTWVKKALRDQGLIEKELNHEHSDFFRAMYPTRYRNMALEVAKNLHVKLYENIISPAKPCNYPFSFCFVRHPLRWYESYWRYAAQMGWRSWGDERDMSHWHPWAVLNGLCCDDFNEFICRLIEKRPGYVSELYASYAQPQVNFIGKQESLTDDLVAVLRKLNLNFDEERIRAIKHANESDRVDNRLIIWDEGLKAEVKRLEYAAFRRYGYDYDAP